MFMKLWVRCFAILNKEMLEKTLCERIEIVILKILTDLLEILSIDVEKTLYDLTSSDKVGKEIIILLNAVNQFDIGFEKTYKEAS